MEPEGWSLKEFKKLNLDSEKLVKQVELIFGENMIRHWVLNKSFRNTNKQERKWDGNKIGAAKLSLTTLKITTLCIVIQMSRSA